MTLLLAAGEGHHVVNELFVPPFFFGLFALVALALLAGITWLFRNKAVTHPEHSEVSPFIPFIHHGSSSH